MAKPNFGKGRDGFYKAMGVGERTSKKVATIRKTDGTSFKRKNANQYGSAEGGNDYYEDRPNRSDKYAKGSTVPSKKKQPKIVRGFFDDEEYEYGQGGTTKGFNYSIGGL